MITWDSVKHYWEDLDKYSDERRIKCIDALAWFPEELRKARSDMDFYDPRYQFPPTVGKKQFEAQLKMDKKARREATIATVIFYLSLAGLFAITNYILVLLGLS